MKKYPYYYFYQRCYSLKKNTTVAPKQQGKYDTNKFSQMYDLLATPNMFRNAAGAPGPAYYQQQADYKIDIELMIKLKINGC
jgi:hypothetical protein